MPNEKKLTMSEKSLPMIAVQLSLTTRISAAPSPCPTQALGSHPRASRRARSPGRGRPGGPGRASSRTTAPSVRPPSGA